MSKWKCGVCNSEFDNYQAQGFNGTIYCPLCYFKELYKRNTKTIKSLNTEIDYLNALIEKEKLGVILRNGKPLEINDNAQNYIEYLENKIDKAIEKVKDICFTLSGDKFYTKVILKDTESGKELLAILGDKEQWQQ